MFCHHAYLFIHSLLDAFQRQICFASSNEFMSFSFGNFRSQLALARPGIQLYYIILYYIILYYIILYYIILYYIILYYIILYSFILFYIILYFIILYYIILYSFILYYIILYYIILYYIAIMDMLKLKTEAITSCRYVKRILRCPHSTSAVHTRIIFQTIAQKRH